MKPVGDILYGNDVDWFENCAALVAHSDARLELLRVEGEPTTVRDDDLMPEAAEPATV